MKAMIHNGKIVEIKVPKEAIKEFEELKKKHLGNSHKSQKAEGGKRMLNYQILLEKLAELEHEQWVEWSKQIAKTENISQERLARWIPLWKPYKYLSPEFQEQDRKWARKVIVLLEKTNQEAKQ